MTARRTFTERRVYSARVMKFRAGVYAGRGKLTPGCQLLLLRLADDMNANATHGPSQPNARAALRHSREIRDRDLIRNRPTGLAGDWSGDRQRVGTDARRRKLEVAGSANLIL